MRKVSNKLLLVPGAALWLWLSALPFLGNLAWWQLALQLPGLALGAVGVAVATQQEPRGEEQARVEETEVRKAGKMVQHSLL